jgi:hypothetical protein
MDQLEGIPGLESQIRLYTRPQSSYMYAVITCQGAPGREGKFPTELEQQTDHQLVHQIVDEIYVDILLQETLT